MPVGFLRCTLFEMTIEIEVNGAATGVPDHLADASLLEVLRDVAGVRSAKDGCAPQGQCGCCTVLVDGKARVACVTPVRRVRGRSVETLEGLDAQRARWWAERFIDHGATQCGFCTPGIIMRLEDRSRRGGGTSADDRRAVDKMLAAHLCRCTGWQGIAETAVEVLSASGDGDATAGHRNGSSGHHDPDAASLRATLEGGVAQRIDAGLVARGDGGFASDTVPEGALVAVPADDGEWVVAESLTEARQNAGRIQGRRTTVAPVPPLEVPPGDWDASLRTCWVEPAYLETDASWCEPGGEPAGVLANGGAFGAKETSPLGAVARRLADLHRRPVLARWSREDSVRLGPKRPPLAVGVRSDGRGRAVVARTPGIRELIALAAPEVVVEEVDLRGPPTSASLRAAGWAEVFCALVAAGGEGPLGGRDGAGVRAHSSDGAWARAEVAHGGPGVEGVLRIEVGAGDPLDETVLRSYVIGAAHMAAGMVCSEGLAVGPDGTVHDLTIRSFGILPASAMPRVDVVLDEAGCSGEPRAVGEVVFAAVAAAVWARHHDVGLWPVGTQRVLGD